MKLIHGRFTRVRELGSIFLVAVGVALASTLAGSVVDHVHQVDAEELTGAEATATAAGTSQVLTLKDWGLTLTLPFGTELPAVTYTTRPGDTVGISSADLAPLGPDCIASRNGLGVLLRSPIGSYANARHGSTISYYITAIGNSEYSYEMPQSDCSDIAQVNPIINRETSIVIGSLPSLAPVAP
jgi:hypothetical protein